MRPLNPPGSGAPTTTTQTSLPQISDNFGSRFSGEPHLPIAFKKPPTPPPPPKKKKKYMKNMSFWDVPAYTTALNRGYSRGYYNAFEGL